MVADGAFPSLVREAILLTRARTVLDIGAGPHEEDEPYAPAVLAALRPDGAYICVEMDPELVEKHRTLTRNDMRMEYHVTLFDRFVRERRGWKADLCISRCFMCLNFSSGPSHESRVCEVMALGRYVLAHDTIVPPPGVGRRDWLHRFGDVIWDFNRPLSSGAGPARIFLVRTR